MALYHIRTKLIKRSKGKLIISAAAYRRATKLFDAQTNRYFDYSAKKDVIHSELIAPDNAPEWIKALVNLHANDPNSAAEFLWNKVEAVEKRVDAQLAREVEFSLPIELDKVQNENLAREFINEVFVKQGMIADWSMHWDQGNPHVHVLLTTRDLTAEGFGKKVRAWNDKSLIQTACLKLAELTNYHLYQHGHDVRIDHRSYAARGIDLIPSIHQGKSVTDMERRGISTEVKANADHIRQENLHRIATRPDILLKKMTNEQSAFTEQRMVQELGRYINDKDRFSNLASFASEQSRHCSTLLKKLNAQEKKDAQAVLSAESILQIFKQIEQHDAIFAEKDLARALSTYTDNAELFSRALVELKNHDNLIHLGLGEDGRDRYTTREMFELENKTQTLAFDLTQAKHFNTHQSELQEKLVAYETKTGKTLTLEQKEAIKHLTGRSKLTCLVGRAGTGKSFTLGAAKTIWQAKGVKVYGVALSGIAATNLAQSADIDSRTIDSFLYALKQNTLFLHKNDVVVMDEAGMTDIQSMHKILQAVTKAQAKLVLVGDPQQLQPVGPGAAFRAVLTTSGFVEIQHIYRQKETWQREATTLLAAGRIKDAIAYYDKKCCVHFAADDEKAKEMLVDQWFTTRTQSSSTINEFLILAHRNEDVANLNELIRASRINKGEIAAGYKVSTKNGRLEIAQGDRLLFTKNDPALGLSNGQFATITDVQFTETGKVLRFDVALDSSQKTVSIDPTKYNDFQHGYAATVHKSQGVTVDHSFVYVGGYGWNKHLTYVAMSRHRESCQLYTSQKTHKQVESLATSLNRYALKDSLIDYPIGFSERRGITLTQSNTLHIKAHLTQRLKRFTQQIKDSYEQAFFPERYWAKKEAEAIKAQEIQETLQRREDAKIVAAYVDANKACGLAWEIYQSELAKLGLNPKRLTADEQKLIKETETTLTLQKRFAERDTLAFSINKEIGRYTDALNIYQIQRFTLVKQANAHLCRERINNYQSAQCTQKTVLRDKLASAIVTEIKIHYGMLKQANIDTSQLRQHAENHDRRILFSQLTPTERDDFRLVESYRLVTRKAGILNKAFMDAYSKEETLKHHQIAQLKELTEQRNHLAFKIRQDVPRYERALDFYQFGNINTIPDNHQNDISMRYAQQRWFKLQQYAASHELSARIQRYQQALFVGDSTLRRALAAEITKDDIQIKAHHAAILANAKTPSALWRVIREDAKAHTKDCYIAQLTADQRQDFALVAAYVKERNATAQAWHEIFDAKENQQLSDDIIYGKLQTFVKNTQYARDKLSANILAEPCRYQSLLEFFQIDIASLEKSALAHDCRERISAYQTASTHLQKASLAQRILEQPKEHFPAIKQANLNWKQLYRDADVIKRQQLFAKLSPQEKRLQRLFHRYQKINRITGKKWSHVFKMKDIQNADKSVTDNLKTKANILSAKRDALATQISQLQKSLQFTALIEDGIPLKEVDCLLHDKRFKADKIQQQASKHEMRQIIIKEWQLAKIQTQKTLQALLTMRNQQTINPGAYLDFLAQQAELDELAKKIKSNPAIYHSALQEVQASITSFNHFDQTFKNLKQHIFNLMDFSEKQKIHSNQNNVLTTEQLAKIAKVKRIVAQTQPIANTLAERYLREHRGIQGELPKSFRFHPGYFSVEAGKKFPALVVIAQNSEQKIQSLQMIYLDPLTAKKASVQNAKMTHGPRNGSVVLINQGKDNRLLAIAEGPETALSIKEIRPDWTIYATLGVSNFANIPINPDTKKIVFCADNDGEHHPSQKQMKNAAKKLSEKGLDVWITMPDKTKQDFNDILLNEGRQAVSAYLDKVALYKQGSQQITLQEKITDSIKNLVTSNSSSVQANTTDLKEFLIHYIDMEMKQTELIHKKHHSTGHEKNEIAASIVAHAEKVKTYAKTLYQHPELQVELKEIQHPALIEKIAARGGIAAIRHRLAENTVLKKDIQALALWIREKAQAQSWSRSQQQARDEDRGRKR